MRTTGCTFLLGLLLAVAAAQGETPKEPSKHWAYRELQVANVPVVVSGNLWASPIDVFLAEKIQQQGWNFNSPADRATLLRRVSFDLTGLPPTREELTSFQADESPDAYERQVDRLLASPRYGERMAVQWLDLAHFADTHGYHADAAREMWRWRDWVIDALNCNMPFDQFTREQIAGDLLPNASLQQRLATGFFRNHMINSEDGAIDEEYRAEYVADRVATLGTVWLGQTLACARCHDHKYDPVSQTEFYQLAALFNQLPENGVAGRTGNAAPTMNAPTRAQQEELHHIENRLRPLEIELAQRRAKIAADLATWERQRQAEVAINVPPQDGVVKYAFEEVNAAAKQVANSGRIGGTADWKGTAERIIGQHRQALLCDGTTSVEQGLRTHFPADQPWSVAAWIYPTTGDRMSIINLSDEFQSQRGWELGLDEGRLFARLTHVAGKNEIRVESKEALPQRRWQQVAIVYAGTGKASGLQLFLNGNTLAQEILADNLTGHTTIDQPLRIARLGESFGFRGLLDEVELFLRPLSSTEVALLAGNDPVGDLLRTSKGQRTAEQQQALEDYYFCHIDPLAVKLQATIEPLQRQQERLLQQVPTVMVLEAGSEYRPTFVLERGLYDQPRQEVQPDLPHQILPPQGSATASAKKRSRIDLANWLVTTASPLTARVAVNRLWQTAWERGLVASSDDFGTRGSPPSHPELLEWLAEDFIRNGWDQKRTLRQIVSSQAYRQTSRPADEQQLAADPHNQWCARGPRGRLPAEMIRDSALFQAGLLVEQIGGRSVVPLQPGDLWRELAFDTKSFSAQSYRPGYGADLVRRSVYTFWKRSSPPANLCLLDAPDRETTLTQRGESNTPLQALLLLNDPTFTQAAEEIARSVISAQCTTDNERLKLVFQTILNRSPSAAETVRWLELLQAERQNNIALDGEVAAWSAVALALLNLDEAITKR